jgi:hypothetical protein
MFNHCNVEKVMFGATAALYLAFSDFVPCIPGVLYFKKFSRPFKMIAMLLVGEALVETGLIVTSYFGRNLFMTHILAVVEILFLSLFFESMLKDPREKKLVRGIMIVLLLLSVSYSLTGNNLMGFNSLPQATESAYFCGLSLYLFYKMSIDLAPVDNGLYFINGSIFFFFSSSFLVFAFSNYKISDNYDLLIMYNVHSIVNVMCNLAYAAGLWTASRSSYSVA